MVKFVSDCVERDKKKLKKWIFVRNYLRILPHSSVPKAQAAGAKHLLRSSVPKAQGISPNESGLFLN